MLAVLSKLWYSCVESTIQVFLMRKLVRLVICVGGDKISAELQASLDWSLERVCKEKHHQTLGVGGNHTFESPA